MKLKKILGWVGKDLHVLDTKNRKIKLTNCYLTRITCDETNNSKQDKEEGILQVSVTFSAKRNDLGV